MRGFPVGSREGFAHSDGLNVGASTSGEDSRQLGRVSFSDSASIFSQAQGEQVEEDSESTVGDRS